MASYSLLANLKKKAYIPYPKGIGVLRHSYKYAQIFTLEGMKTAYLGYHIVKNINGSFEVFHPNIFKSEYTIL
jgi:hypothetical protein